MKLIPVERIEQKIFLIRGQKVMLDRDLAKLYGVSTKRLNEQVKRNLKRFPSDFMIQITKKEKDEVVANCDHLQELKYSYQLPYAFTEHGAIMLAAVLNTPLAIRTSVQVVRAFVKLRKVLATHLDLKRKIEDILRVHGGKLQEHDHKIAAIFDLINKLLEPEKKANKRIGFITEE